MDFSRIWKTATLKGDTLDEAIDRANEERLTGSLWNYLKERLRIPSCYRPGRYGASGRRYCKKYFCKYPILRRLGR